MLTCTRLIPRFCPNAHHHGSLPQQLGVVWDRLLKTDLEGPTLISRAAYPHDWSVHDELLSVCACSTLNPRRLVPFPESNLANPTQFRTPAEGLVGIDQAIVDNPNLVLKRALEGKTIKNTVVLDVSSDTSTPVFGGGLANTAFLQGSPNEGPNAQPALVTATYWIETLKDDAGGPDVQQLQY